MNRRWMSILLGGSLSFTLTTGAASADDAPIFPDWPIPQTGPEKLRWVGSVDKALAEARIRNVPVLAVIADAPDVGFNYMLATVLLEPGMAKIQEYAVPLIAMKGREHVSGPTETPDGPKWICPVFKVECDEYEASYHRLFNGFVFREFWQPVLLFLKPDGTELFRLEGHQHKLSRVIRETRKASEKVGKGLSMKAYRKVVTQVMASREAIDNKDIPLALKSLSSLRTSNQGVTELVRMEKARMNEMGRREMTDALRSLLEGKRKDAIDKLSRVVSTYDGLDIAEEARKELKDLRSKS